MSSIAFITSSEDPNLTQDDLIAVKLLEQEGHRVLPIIWDQIEPRSIEADLLVFRSCWNYHVKYGEFCRWLEALEDIKVPTWNSLGVVRWNLHKQYLLEFSQRGVLIPRTILLSPNEGPEQRGQSLQALTSPQIILKPAISLNGHDTYLIENNPLQIEATLPSLRGVGDVLAQEFLPEIQSDGEVSLVFFQKKFSHALRKVPKAGEFRVQVEYGGRRLAYQPSKSTIEQAEEVLEKINEPLLFARVDVVERGNALLLMELEVIDPMLFLGYDDLAAERFVRAILSCL